MQESRNKNKNSKAISIPLPSMRHKPLPAAFFARNRRRLFDALPASSLAAICSNYLFYSNADSVLPFYQNTSLRYLCGIVQEDTTLLMHKNSNGECKSILFVKKHDKKTEVWDGKTLTFDEAQQVSAVDSIQPNHEFHVAYRNFALKSGTLYFALNESLRLNAFKPQDSNAHLLATVKQQFPLHSYARLSPLLAKLRAVKSKAEIQAIENAIGYTREGLQLAAGRLADAYRQKQKVIEYELEAELSYAFIKNGCKGHAFSPIVASGKNACTLHYLHNHCEISPPDAVLIDCGTDHCGYNSDITRVLPSALTFTDRQAQVYDAVYAILAYAKSLLKDGLPIKKYSEMVSKRTTTHLQKLGLVPLKTSKKTSGDSPKTTQDYFMHSVSHQLGLDVHDVFDGDVLKTGMVITVEPGIYIAEEGIGIRLEDNVVIEKNGSRCLSSSIPLKRNDIEAMMQTTVK